MVERKKEKRRRDGMRRRYLILLWARVGGRRDHSACPIRKERHGRPEAARSHQSGLMNQIVVNWILIYPQKGNPKHLANPDCLFVQRFGLSIDITLIQISPVNMIYNATEGFDIGLHSKINPSLFYTEISGMISFSTNYKIFMRV